MEKNKPISVAFEDIRNNPDFIEHSEYRFINDDLGMVISFQAMGFRLFRTQQPYRAKEGRIVRIMQGKGRISINLIEYEATAHDIIIIPDNSLIEISEVSPDYEFQVIMPTANFLPVLQNSILSEAYTRNGIRLFMQQRGMGTHQQLLLFIVEYTTLFALPPRSCTALDCLTSL